MTTKSILKGLTLTAVLLTSVQSFSKTTYLMNSRTFDQFGENQAIKVVTENGKSHFAYCDVTLTAEKNLDFDCSQRIGNRDGYTDADLDKVDEALRNERKLEYAADALIVAGMIVNYKVAAKNMAARQTMRYNNGTHAFSGVKGYLSTNIESIKRSMIETRAALLVLGLGGKAIFIDDASDKQDALSEVEETAQKSTDEEVVLLEGFSADDSADLLSRALNN